MRRLRRLIGIKDNSKPIYEKLNKVKFKRKKRIHPSEMKLELLEQGTKIRVGKISKDLKKIVTYNDIKHDFNNWVDASLYLPNEYDLCHCKMKDKTLPGWYTGHHWEGYRINIDDEILYWKLNHDF